MEYFIRPVWIFPNRIVAIICAYMITAMVSAGVWKLSLNAFVILTLAVIMVGGRA